MMAYRLVTGKTVVLPTDHKRQPMPGGPNLLEGGFLRLWLILFPDLPKPEREFRFHATRKWRFDFAWPQARLAVELEGMIYGGGRHQRRVGFTQDAEKYRAATEAGWRVLRYTSDEVKTKPVQCLEQVARILSPREGKK